MPRLALTTRAIESARTPSDQRLELWDATLRGLVLRVTPDGIRTWCIVYRHHGRKRRLTLGRYPGLGLAAARRAARVALAATAKGGDPAGDKRDERAKWADTVGALVALYVPVGRTRRTWPEKQRIFETEILPYWRHRPVTDITRRDVRDLIEAKARTAPVMANRVLAEISALFNYALSRDWVAVNPAARMPKPGQEGTRDRVLSSTEIRELWQALHEPDDSDRSNDAPTRLPPAMSDLFLALLLTGQRLGEVSRMKWVDLDLKGRWWTIPAVDTKNADPHRVPLSRPMLEVLRRRRAAVPKDEPYVFSNTYRSHVGARARKAAALLSQGLSFTFRAHDLRRTVASGLGASGIPREHIAHVLNHRSVTRRAITAIYDRYSYDKEKRAALEAWAVKLSRVTRTREPRRTGDTPPPTTKPRMTLVARRRTA